PSSRQKGTPVASTRLSPLGSPRSSHSPIRSNGRTPSSSEPCRRGGRWSYRISSRCLKRGMLLLSIIAGAKINHGKGGYERPNQTVQPTEPLVLRLRRNWNLCFKWLGGSALFC